MLSTSFATQMGNFSYKFVRITHLGSGFLFDTYILCIEKEYQTSKKVKRNKKTRMMRKITFIFIMCLVTIASNAQCISGRVNDEHSQPMPFANVVLVNRADSSFIAGAVTKDDGTFSIDTYKKDGLLKVSSVGYIIRYLDARQGNVGDIQMQPDTQTLGEVVVKGQMPTHKMTTEGVLTTVENTLLSKAGTANDVLQQLPGVQKKGDGIEVFGKGTPLIYINGRQLRDKSELDQISSESVKSVELITTPGAKYDAQVESVILIKTRRQQGEGWSGDVQSHYRQGYNPDLDLGLNLNYRHNGLDVFGSVWYNDDQNRQRDLITLDVVADTLWHMTEQLNSDTHHRSFYVSAGVNYVFNDQHSMGFRYDTKAWLKPKMTGSFIADVTADGVFYDHLDNKLEQETTSNMPHTLNVYYNGRVGKTTIDFNTDYIFHKDRTSQFTNEVSQERTSRTVTSTNVVRNQLWASKLVLSWPLWKGNLQAGTEYDITNRNDDYVNPEQVVPTSQTEQRERNYIFFAEYSRSLPFGQMRVGLRNENVSTDYYLRGIHQPEQSRSYHHFFPTVALMAKAGKVQLMANYAMKIQRPYYWMLSSNVTYANRFTWESGNPMLQPTIRNEVGLMAMYKWMRLAVDYKHTTDEIVNVAETVAGNEATTIITRANVHRSDGLRAMLTLSPRFGLYQPSLTVGVIKDWIKIPSPVGNLSPKNPIGLIQSNNDFQLSPTLTASASLQVMTTGDQQNMTVTKPGYVADVSVTKTFFDNRLSVRLGGRNLFNSQQHINIRYGLRSLYQEPHKDSRKFELSVRYNFNATNSKYKGTGAGNDEKNRF
jgi:hypothetical protein